jgi:DNA-binding GntR family transcriptional regulator
MEVSTSYLPGAFKDHAPALLKTQKLPVQGGTAGYIEKMLGKRITAGRDQTCSRLATEDEIQDLQLEQGASVLGGRNTWFTDADEPVEYGISAVVQGRWRTDEYSLS